jgi:hypothetical protein
MHDTWEEAKAAGEKYYYGKPCKNGHLSIRRVISAHCIFCERERHNRDYASGKYHSRDQNLIDPKRVSWRQKYPGMKAFKREIEKLKEKEKHFDYVKLNKELSAWVHSIEEYVRN